MRFFDRLMKQQVEDPSLGTLTLGRRGWEGGQIALRGQENTVSVLVERRELPPQDEDRKSVMALLANYDELVPAIRTTLFEVWQPFLAATQEAIWPRSSDALWSMLQLEHITVRESGTVELAYAFCGDVWPDAMLSVQVDEIAVAAGSLDD